MTESITKQWKEEFEKEEQEKLLQEQERNEKRKYTVPRNKVARKKQRQREKLHKVNKRLGNAENEEKLFHLKKQGSFKNKSSYNRWDSVKDWKDHEKYDMPYKDRKKL